MLPQLYAFPGNEAFATGLSPEALPDLGCLDLHRFPDGETRVRLDTPPQADVAFVCALHDPDRRTVPLLLAAATARELGARRVGLIAPYLGYMRQDRRFAPGVALSALHNAPLLSPQL
jgi:ribose-phosphate pyrophosphokinase